MDLQVNEQERIQLAEHAARGDMPSLMKILRELIDKPRVVDVTASTLTVTERKHAGKIVTLNRAAGITVTLPAAKGTGAKYEFVVGTTVTSNSYKIQVANASDVMMGVLGVSTDAAGVNIPTAATSDTITMNGSTQGGVLGSRVVLEDVAENQWAVSGALVSTGVEATPFSAAV